MTKKSDWLGAFAAGGIVVLFCLVLLWHDPLIFWNDDYELSILPVFADVARSWSEGHLPLLSPYSWICGNLAGEFQYGTFSVFVNAAVVLIWKLPLTFPQQAAALSIAHLFVLAMGGYLLARDRRLDPPFAMIVASVAALNGWMICWGASDWFGALGAFAWLPWAWWGMERAVDPARGKWRFVWPAPFVYLVVAGGFPYTVLMLGLVAVWLTMRELVRSRSFSSVFALSVGVFLGLGMSAPAWLALLEYVRGSAREAQEAAAHWQWRVPIAAIPGLFLPNWTVNWSDFSTRLMPHGATELACGLVPPVALLAGAYSLGRQLLRRIGSELALLGILLVLAMLPTAGVFRWSFRWLPLLHVVLALCGAIALQELASHSKLRLAAVSSLAIVGGLALVMWLCDLGGPFVVAVLSATFVVLLIWCCLTFLIPDYARWLATCVTIAVLLLSYLLIPPNCGVPKYNLSQELLEPSPLDRNHLYLSFYPHPEHTYRADKRNGPIGQVVRPGSTAMWAGVPMINGYSPIRPAGVARHFNSGIHGELDYEITERALRFEGGSEGELARLGIDAIIVSGDFNLQPQPAEEWQLVHSSAEGSVYHRGAAPLPIARGYWDAELTQPNTSTSLRVVEHSRNRVVVDYNGDAGDELPVFVAFSRPYFAGYIATGDRRRLDVTSYRGLIPVVELPPGFTGRLTLSYRPTWLVAGGIAAAISVAVVLLGFTRALGEPSKRRACSASLP